MLGPVAKSFACYGKVCLAWISDHIHQAVPLKALLGCSLHFLPFLFAKVSSVFHLEIIGGADYILKSWLGALCMFHRLEDFREEL